jgi:Fe-S-cluster containining protein
MNYKEIDIEIEKFIKTEQEKGNCIACEKNCSDCCTNVPLLVTPSELDFIVFELNKLNTIQKKNISKNIKQLDKKYTSKPEHNNSIEDIQNSRAFNMNYKCPFLLGSSCMVYNARPILCRTYMSSDKSLCKNGTGNMLFKLPDNLININLIKDYDTIKNNQIRSHAHRSIEYKNGRFISMSNVLLKKANMMNK